MKNIFSRRIRHNNIVILTATITPPSEVPFLARKDPLTRLKDYEESLKFYISLLANQRITSVVFVENSNSDISTLRAIAEQASVSDKTEFLVFDGLDHPASFGRAYGEFKLLDYAMEHSEIIKHQPENTKVWKITGRYIISNLAQIIQRQPSNFDLYCNFRKIPKPWVDLYLLSWSIKGYETSLKSIYPKLKTEYDIAKVHPEELFVNLLEKISREITVKYRIHPTPVIRGVKGADNQNYLEGRNLRKFYLRNLSQKLFPWLWI